MKVLQVFKKPIITEKSYKIMEDNKYLFFVNVKADKPTIKKTFEEVFNVQVLSVNILKYKAKPKRVGRFLGKKPAYKKAIIKLKPGEKLTLFQESTNLSSDSEKTTSPKKGFFQKLKDQFNTTKKAEEANSSLSSKTENAQSSTTVKDVKPKNENN